MKNTWKKRLEVILRAKMKKHEVCPRQPAGKTEVGKRIKMAITVDFELHDRLQELYQQGYSISHLIDSAVWIIWEGPNLASSWERRK